MNSSISFSLCCSLYLGLTATIQASETTTPRKVAIYDNWSVFVADNPKLCWVDAISADSGAKNRLRFTFFPDSGKREPSYISLGKEFEKGSIIIGKNNWKLLSDNSDTAWVEAGNDISVFGGMWTGTSATVKIKTSSDIEIIDAFSLKGFAAAARNAQQRCGM